MASLNCFILALFAALMFSGIDVGLAARRLQQLPPIPTLPTTGLPQPTIPALPTLPKPGLLPPLPTIPNLPTVPKVTLPPLPSFPSIPAIPTTIPSIPFLSPPPSTTKITALAEWDQDFRHSTFKSSSPASKTVVDELLSVIEEHHSTKLRVPAIKAVGSLARISYLALTCNLANDSNSYNNVLINAGAMTALQTTDQAIAEEQPELEALVSAAISKLESNKTEKHQCCLKMMFDRGFEGTLAIVTILTFGGTIGVMVANDGNWNWDAFCHHLSDHVLENIAAINQPSSSLLIDKPGWVWDKYMTFSVKSTYIHRNHQPSNPACPFWRTIQQFKGPQRIQSFLWLLYKGHILTNVECIRCHLADDPSCPSCSAGLEDIDHLVRHCSYSVEWFDQGLKV
ncbi:hypothetical protein V6N11_027276 [Hibiscus sabdariffa]|uniref:Reverse transcriptase zinc-binding domain-containing protein n=1 Tax=Hibiscus sabdariffa TaxID=183260 RepID=A0ABR2PGZ2_9ROSI